MLTLTRPHRQVLFTLAIVLLTMAPTGYVAFTAWQVNRPAHRHEVAAELGRQLGLNVEIESVRYPRPGQVIYTGAVLRQPEPRRENRLVEVARADRLSLARQGRQLVLRAEGLRLSGGGPRQAMEQVGELLSRAGDDAWDRVALSADVCTIDLGEGMTYAMRDLAGSFRIDRGTPTVEASYRIVTAEGTPNRCELVLIRDRKGEQPETTLTLRLAEGLPLPARVLEPFFSSDAWLGPKARVLGELTLTRAGAEDWRAVFSGDLIDVDLGTLVGRRVPDHRLSGLARVTVQQAEWGPRPGGPGSGWLSASGELTAGPGTVSASLLNALQTEMQFRLAAPFDARLPRTTPASPDGDLDFQGLGLRFAIEPDGEIQLAGALGDAYQPHTVLIEPDALDPIAFAPDGVANLIGLRRTLGPVDTGEGVQVIPVSPELRFLDYLPLAGTPRPDAQRAN